MEFSQKDLSRYSLARLIKAQLSGRADGEGFEKECSQELNRESLQHPDGAYVPWGALLRTQATRDLNATTFGQGGAFIPTKIETPIVPILRNLLVTGRLGATVLGGLSGSIAIPRQTSTATAYSLPESATLTKSTATVDQVLLTPHRVGATTEFTKQLALQSSVDVENFISDDLLETIRVRLDKLALEGSGADSEPTGILNITGIGSIVFGGAITWSKVVSFETSLAAANAMSERGKFGYVTSPTAKGILKCQAKTGVGVTTTTPTFLWETNTADSSGNSGRLNDYPAIASNQIGGNRLCFGNWADLIIGVFGPGFDLLTNPYSRDQDAVVRVTANLFGDVAVRHAESFAWSFDAVSAT